jgi:hypothetical protein
MPTNSVTTGRMPRDLWINVRTFVCREHESILERTLCSLNGMDAQFAMLTVLAVDGLTETDFKLLEIAVPNIYVMSTIADQLVIGDESSFDAVEDAIGSLGSHLSCGRFVVAQISLKDRATFGLLKKAFAQQPNVFAYGLERTN